MVEGDAHPGGPATVRAVALADGTIQVEAWGAGAAYAIEAAPGLCGLLDDPSGFEADGLVGELHRLNPGLRICRTGAIFEALAPYVLEQRVSGLEAYRSWRRLVRGMSERAPGPIELWLPPDPKRIAAEPYTAFHDYEIEAGSANTLRRAAARATGLERFAPLTRRGHARADLASGHRGLDGGDGDGGRARRRRRRPVGDYGIPGMVGHVLANERDADDARMLELLEPFTPQRGRAIRLIGLSGNYPARRAPRARVRTLRGH